MSKKIEKEKLFMEENWLIMEKERHFLDQEVLDACFKRLPSSKHPVYEIVCRSREECSLAIYLAPNNVIIGFSDTESWRFTPTQFKSGFVGENLRLKGYSSLSEDEKIYLQSTLWEKNKHWLNQKFQELNAAWITVVDGEIKSFSSDLAEYPQETDILKICEEGKFPFIFINKELLTIEEEAG